MDLETLKKEKGITLIALAVTIVVLLILAGVTISSVFSENGIIKKAQEAQTKIDEAQKNDLESINYLSEEVNKYLAESVDLNNYVTLNFNTFVGKYTRQNVDYMGMYIEIADNEGNDKIIFNIGNDWKENIEIETSNKSSIFTKQGAELTMIRDLQNDNINNSNEENIDNPLIGNSFTNVNLKCYLKKDKQYNLKVFYRSATIKNSIIATKWMNIYEKDIESTSENININVAKAEIQYKKMFDLNNDSTSDSTDAALIRQICNKQITSENGITPPIYKTYNESGVVSKTIMQLIDENGKAINEDFIGADFNRDGYISSEEDARIPNSMFSQLY